MLRAVVAVAGCLFVAVAGCALLGAAVAVARMTPVGCIFGAVVRDAVGWLCATSATSCVRLAAWLFHPNHAASVFTISENVPIY